MRRERSIGGIAKCKMKIAQFKVGTSRATLMTARP